MAGFDDFGRKFSDFGRGVKKKQQDVSSSSRLNNQIKNLNASLADAYQKLGIQYYHLSQSGQNPGTPIFELTEQIKSMEDQKEALIAELQMIKGFSICPVCHASVPRGSVFCNFCGAKMPAEPAPEMQQTAVRYCPNCHAQLTPEQLFCVECGTRVNGPVSAEDSPDPSIDNQKETEAEGSVEEFSPSSQTPETEQPEKTDEDVPGQLPETKPAPAKTVLAEEAEAESGGGKGSEAEEPAAEASSSEILNADEPKTDEPKTDESETDKPETDEPETAKSDEEKTPAEDTSDTSDATAPPETDREREHSAPPIEEGAGNQINDTLKCPWCGEPVEPDQIFCIYCGKKLV